LFRAACVERWTRSQASSMDVNATLPGGATPEYAFKLWNFVIRPPRTIYDPSQLGPTEFMAGGIRAARRDLHVRSKSGKMLACSHFVPRQDRKKELRKFPVIIYLHGNSSSRLEAWSLVGTLISQNISLFCYDAAGCGMSEGEYVSLGWHERDDLAAVIAHLRHSPFCGPIGIWGRSMGAATALLHADRDPNIGAICLDSSFASLRQLAEELAQNNRLMVPVPSWLIDAALAVIRMRVQALADFDIEDLVPIEHASRSSIPAIFLHGRQDSFIQPGHSQQLYQAYNGDKEFITVDGDHNSERNEQVVQHVVNFFRRSLRLDYVDMSVPSHILDREFAVPQRESPMTAMQDGRPLRVPLSRKNAPATVRLSEIERHDEQELPPPVAMRPLPSKSKPVQGSGYEFRGPGGLPPPGDMDDEPSTARIFPRQVHRGAGGLAARGGA